MKRSGVKSAIVLATGRQLWRLNEQGMLRLELSPEPYEPGVLPEEGAQVAHADAVVALGRVQAERWHPLARWLKRGEAWRVEDGRVVAISPPTEGPQ